MKVVLLYPPISNVRYPYLSLPSLSAFLKREGYGTVVKDVNLEAFYHLIPPSELGEMDPHILQEAFMAPGIEGERNRQCLWFDRRREKTGTRGSRYLGGRVQGADEWGDLELS